MENTPPSASLQNDTIRLVYHLYYLKYSEDGIFLTILLRYVAYVTFFGLVFCVVDFVATILQTTSSYNHAAFVVLVAVIMVMIDHIHKTSSSSSDDFYYGGTTSYSVYVGVSIFLLFQFLLRHWILVHKVPSASLSQDTDASDWQRFIIQVKSGVVWCILSLLYTCGVDWLSRILFTLHVFMHRNWDNIAECVYLWEVKWYRLSRHSNLPWWWISPRGIFGQLLYRLICWFLLSYVVLFSYHHEFIKQQSIIQSK